MKSHALNTCVNTSVNKTVALDLRVHSRAIENRVAQAIHLHLRHGKWIANNVLRKSLNILTLMRRDATALVYVESRMHPTAQNARSIQRQQSNFDQERDHARAKQLLQLGVIAGKVEAASRTICSWTTTSTFPSRQGLDQSTAVTRTNHEQNRSESRNLINKSVSKVLTRSAPPKYLDNRFGVSGSDHNSKGNIMKKSNCVDLTSRLCVGSATSPLTNCWLLSMCCAAAFCTHADCFAAQSGATTVVLNNRDLSGDGIADYVIATPWIAQSAGIDDVWDGATGELIVQFTGLTPGDGFGASLAFTGDLNSDGLPELLIGAPGSQRAYLAIGPFADVSDPAVSAARLNHELSSPDGTTTDFGFDVAGLYDFDGDMSPDLRVAAHVTAADGTASTKTFIFNGVTGGLIGTCTRSISRPTIERAVADTDRDAKVTVTDLATVFENLGATEVDGATNGDVTGDGEVDGADVGLVGSSLGNELYGDVISTDAPCPEASVSIQAIGETVCVHAENTTVLAAVVVEGIGNPVDPADIIHPEPNECGDRIRACLTDPHVIAAAQLVGARCWPASGGGPTGIIGRIYCAPCGGAGVSGETIPRCSDLERIVNITICKGSLDGDCVILAHELTHVSHACQYGLFSEPPSCGGFEDRWGDSRHAICSELEAYQIDGQCHDGASNPTTPCCEFICASVGSLWQRATATCIECCEEAVRQKCCDGGLMRHTSPCMSANTPCETGGPLAP